MKLKCKFATMKKTILFAIALTIAAVSAAKTVELAPSYAWTTIPPLGLRQAATIDTVMLNYYRQAIPSEAFSAAYATTGNTASPGENMIFFDRQPMSDFFFRDALQAWLPSQATQKFYNTRIPMTLLSYNTGGGRENAQDRLKGVFSGNAGKEWQVGAMVDYIYSKGSYDFQAAKNLTWGASASYTGERYEMQAFFYHYNNLNKENGGITDDRYITDPAELQGGTSSINPKSIPTRLTAAHSRVRGSEFYLNNRYKVGFWQEEQVNDTTVHRTYVPVSSFIWTLNYTEAKHMFLNTNATEAAKFWDNTYFTPESTRDFTTYWSLRNTVGVALLEGFNKYAKAGLSAFATHEIHRYRQSPYTTPTDTAGLTPLPPGRLPEGRATENLLWVGAQLTKQQGRILNYDVTARFGMIGRVAGDIDIHGNIHTHIPLLGDTVNITGYGAFSNTAPAYLMDHYVSNHFVWENDFGKTRRFRAGGVLYVPVSGTHVNIGVENIQNLIYFNTAGMPVQDGGSVQVFSASLRQNLHAGILHWDNTVTYQKSSDDKTLPLPALTIYSNLYLLFKVARVLDVQLGIDCDYYTRYHAPGYQPATMTFYNQRDAMCGNYPFMNAYINMKLSKCRFYVMFSHVNQGLIGGDNYFSMPHYPLNPRRFQMGVSVDFTN